MRCSVIVARAERGQRQTAGGHLAGSQRDGGAVRGGAPSAVVRLVGWQRPLHCCRPRRRRHPL